KRAATKPSPPLLPGPATTATRTPGGWRAATVSATERPAFSISSMPATPPAIVRRSASAISAGVSHSIIAAAGQCDAEARATLRYFLRLQRRIRPNDHKIGKLLKV